jgi:hypothetical protein
LVGALIPLLRVRSGVGFGDPLENEGGVSNKKVPIDGNQHKTN